MMEKQIALDQLIFNKQCGFDIDFQRDVRLKNLSGILFVWN